MRAAVIFLLLSVSAHAAPQSGDEVYKKRCSGCHDQVTPRIPHREALQKMPSARILRALDSGAMMAIAFVMSRDERLAVASYLGTDAVIPGPPSSVFCNDRTVRITTNSTSGWNGWSPGVSNTRFQPSEVAGLTIDQVKRLK